MDKDTSEQNYLFYRDEHGELIPQEIEIDTGETILAKPLARGEIRRFLSDDDLEKHIFLNNVVIPKYTLEDLEYITPQYSKKIVNKVLEISGVISGKRSRAEDDFAKRLERIKMLRSEADLTLFLHRLGYTYFNIGALTYSELTYLIDAWNREVEEKNREIKRHSK